MSEKELIQEAELKGFLSAATIRPAHLLSKPDLALIISPEAKLQYSNGSLYFVHEDSNRFKNKKGESWTGTVYSPVNNGEWAEIVSYREKTEPLRDFPLLGVCWKPTKELLNYLKKRKCHKYGGTNPDSEYLVAGLAWNTDSIWKVQKHSQQKEYKIEQLTPFLSQKRVSLTEWPVTPEECYQEEEIKPGDYVMLNEPGNAAHGVKGYVERIYTDQWNKKPCIELKEPLPRHPEGGQLKAFPLSKAVLLHEPVPDKWCIRIDENNKHKLSAFLYRNTDKYKGYTVSWKPETNVGSYFFYPQPEKGAYAASSIGSYKGYTEVTLKQILHVLTHTDKQIENNLKITDYGSRGERESGSSCKVQGLNYQIRCDSPVREIGIRCPTSKISRRIGSSED